MNLRTFLAMAGLFAPALACTDPKPSAQRTDLPPLTTLEPVGSLRESDGVAFETDPLAGTYTREDALAFVDVSNQQIALFDRDGKQTGTLGRRGQGPGEFQGAEAMFALSSDSLAAFDRQRQSMTFVVNGKISLASIDFQSWQFDFDDALRIVGRFANGDWVGLKRSPRPHRGVGARAVFDTPTVVVGSPSQPPRELFRLPPRRLVNVVGPGWTTRIALTELAPASGTVCDSGIVVADTLGVRVISVTGKVKSSFRLPVKRLPLTSLTGGRDGVVARAVYRLRPGAQTVDAMRVLASFAAGVDSMLQQPTLDARGDAWFPTFVKGGVSGGIGHLRFDTHGAIVGTYTSAQAPTLIGQRSFLALGVEKETESGVFHVYPLKNNTQDKMELGFCSTPFQF
jgi:hypothetical protein